MHKLVISHIQDVSHCGAKSYGGMWHTAMYNTVMEGGASCTKGRKLSLSVWVETTNKSSLPGFTERHTCCGCCSGRMLPVLQLLHCDTWQLNATIHQFLVEELRVPSNRHCFSYCIVVLRCCAVVLLCCCVVVLW